MTTGNVRQGKRLVSILAIFFVVGVILATGGAVEPAGKSASPGDKNWVDPKDELLRWPVEPNQDVPLTAPINGIMDDILVEEMQIVKAGQLLAKMDDKVQLAEVRVAEKTVEEAEKILAEVQLRYEGVRKLHQEDAGGSFEVRQKKLEVESSAVKVDVAKAKLEQQNELLTRYQIKAPFDGEIRRIEAEKGARLNQGDEAMTIVSRNPLKSEMNLPVTLMRELEIGKTYRFAAEEPVNREIRGTLKILEQQIDPASGTFRCVFEFENPDLKLPGGFYVRLMWPQTEAQAER